MKQIARTAIAGILTLLATASAFGQSGGIGNFPQTIPAQTVVGRLGITPGPTQAIPISQLAAVFGATQSVTTNAKCDGATDDTAAINADLAQGGWWTLPPGKTCAVTQLNITVSGTRLSGSGFNTSIIKGTTASVPTINVSASLSNIYLDGFQVTKSVTATSGGTGIKMNGDCQYCVIDGVFVQKHYVGIALQSAGVAYMRHVMAQQNLSDGIAFTNSSVSGTLQWDLDDIFSGQNAGRGFSVASGGGSGGISLGSWHNIRTFANTGVGVAFVGTASYPINGIRITKGFIGNDNNHGIFLDTYGGLHTIGSSYIELSSTSASGPTLSTPANHAGDGIRITANNLDVSISDVYLNGNNDSGINTSATVITNVSGYRISNHALNGILAANCALLTATSTNFAGNGTNINCTTNSNSQLVATSTPAAVNTYLPSFGNATLNGNLSATGSISSAGEIRSTSNINQVYPASGFGMSIVGNFSGGSAEVDFFNINNSASDSFRFYQKTGTSAATLAMSISPTGALSVGDAATTRTNLGIRQPLTANTTFNVATTGTDSNSCVSATPCLTIQRAYDNLANFYDLRGFTATIQVANGTYSAGLITAKCVPGQNGPASVKILGNATPSNVVIGVTSTDAFGLGETAFGSGTQGCTQITIGGMKITVATAGNAINISGGGVGITVGTSGFPIEFGAAAQNHMVTNHGAWLIAGTNNLVSGNATIHAAALSNSVLALHNTTETFSNSPVFTYYAFADTNSSLYVTNMVFTSGGTVTGTRFFANNNGIIFAQGSATYLPGNSAGTELEGGRYIANTGANGMPLFTNGVMTYITPGFTAPVAIGSLPSCAAGTKGARSFVTDNNTALSFAAVITSGGSIQTPVYCDGSVWRQG